MLADVETIARIWVMRPRRENEGVNNWNGFSYEENFFPEVRRCKGTI